MKRNLYTSDHTIVDLINIEDKIYVRKRNIDLSNEIRILKELNHNHIIKLVWHTIDYIVFEYDNHKCCFNMIFEDNISEAGKLPLSNFTSEAGKLPLSNFTSEAGKLPLGNFLRINAYTIFKQVLSALKYLHSNNIIHCDVKPENIVTNEKLDTKLIDFGLALEINENTEYIRFPVPINDNINNQILQKHSKTRTLWATGTPLYAAPELLTLSHNDKKIKFTKFTSAVDLWSLGISFYIMLTGEIPFDNITFTENYDNYLLMYYRIKDFNVKKVIKKKQLDKNINKILTILLNKNPKKRYAQIPLA